MASSFHDAWRKGTAMSASVTNRVYLPDGQKIYITDDCAGDERMFQLYEKFGNLKMEACHKEWGKLLDDMKPFWAGTIEEQYS